jgi:hypothetical protein
MKIDIPFIGKGKPRECGDCTKCCEGFLRANIDGRPMTIGQPCHWVEIGVGCTRYETRPKYPCKTFECAWLTSKTLPEEMKPNKSGYIFKQESLHGVEHFSVIEAPNKIEDLLPWLSKFQKEKDINFVYAGKNKMIEYVASKKFIEEHKLCLRMHKNPSAHGAPSDSFLSNQNKPYSGL